MNHTITFTKPCYCAPLDLAAANAFISQERRVISAYIREPGRIGNCHFDNLSVEIADPRYRRPGLGTEPDIYVQRHIADKHPWWQPLTAKAHDELVRQVANAVRGSFDELFVMMMAAKQLAAGPDDRIVKLRSYADWIEHQVAFGLEVAARLADGTASLRKRDAMVTTVDERDAASVAIVDRREMRTRYPNKSFDIVADGEVIGWYTNDGEAVSAYSPSIH